MENITPEALLIALGVLLAACGLLAAVWKAVEAWRKLSHADERKAAEARQNDAIAALDRRVAKCEERLSRGDAQFANLHSDMTQVLTVLNAMTMHFLSGNDKEKLRIIQQNLYQYIAKRKEDI